MALARLRGGKGSDNFKHVLEGHWSSFTRAVAEWEAAKPPALAAATALANAVLSRGDGMPIPPAAPGTPAYEAASSDLSLFAAVRGGLATLTTALDKALAARAALLAALDAAADAALAANGTASEAAHHAQLDTLLTSIDALHQGTRRVCDAMAAEGAFKAAVAEALTPRDVPLEAAARAASWVRRQDGQQAGVAPLILSQTALAAAAPSLALALGGLEASSTPCVGGDPATLAAALTLQGALPSGVGSGLSPRATGLHEHITLALSAWAGELWGSSAERAARLAALAPLVSAAAAQVDACAAP